MADLRKEELFPADAFGLFYLQITRIPGGWHRHAEYEIFYHMHSKIPSEISDSTVRALRGFCVSRNGDQISIIPFSSCAIYIVNPAVLFFAAKKSKSKMDILHSFSPFFTPQDWFDAPCFMICNKIAKSVAQCAKKTEKDLCGIFLTIVIY